MILGFINNLLNIVDDSKDNRTINKIKNFINKNYSRFSQYLGDQAGEIYDEITQKLTKYKSELSKKPATQAPAEKSKNKSNKEAQSTNTARTNLKGSASQAVNLGKPILPPKSNNKG